MTFWWLDRASSALALPQRKDIGECRLDPRSRAWRKAELLNLLVEIDRAYIKEGREWDPTVAGANLGAFFARVDAVGSGSSDVDEVTTYYKAAIQATNDRSNRIRRGQVIAKVLREGITF